MANTKTTQDGRTAFREEFYQDVKPFKKSAKAAAGTAKARRRKRKTSIILPLLGLFFLLCLIAVAGSSAMIWLRKLGTLFGVEWSGDG